MAFSAPCTLCQPVTFPGELGPPTPPAHCFGKGDQTSPGLLGGSVCSCECRFQCRCVWEGIRCPNKATQEDQLCDWCGTRRPEQMVNNPKAVFSPDGEYLGLGGAGEVHDAPLVYDADYRIPPGKTAACWYENSGRTLA